jgi:predicted enzyme related to lactoylglutathione lyase
MEPPVLKGVKFVSIPVRDQQRALEFYTEQLGFRVLTDQPMGPDQRWIELGLPRADTRVVLFTPPGHEDRVGGFMNVTFMADDVCVTAGELESRGVTFVQAPRTEPWGTSAIFVDSEGNQFVLSTP